MTASHTDAGAGMPGDHIGDANKMVADHSPDMVSTRAENAHVGLPSEETIAKLISGAPFPSTKSLTKARAILSLIRPAFEAKEREIERLKRIERNAWSEIELQKARALAAESKLAQAVEDERQDTLDALTACEKGAAGTRMPGFAHIGDLRDGLSRLWKLRDEQRARSASARGETT